MLWNDKSGEGRERGTEESSGAQGLIGSVFQLGHWRSISLFSPGDAQSDSSTPTTTTATSIIYACRKLHVTLITQGYSAYSVHAGWGVVQRAGLGENMGRWGRRGIDFVAESMLFLLSLYLSEACSCPACLSAFIAVCCPSGYPTQLSAINDHLSSTQRNTQHSYHHWLHSRKKIKNKY